LRLSNWETDLHIHHHQRKEAVLRKFTVCLLTFAFSAIMIAQLSSALIIQFHSQQVQFNEEDTLELGIKTPIKWFHRQIDFGRLQPITGSNISRIFKKTAIILPAPIQL